MSEQESCPACGALPCDWVWNPRADTESELVAARARIAELERENAALETNCRDFNEAGLVAFAERDEALRNVTFWERLCNDNSDSADRFAAECDTLKKRIAELSETWTDDNGTVWSPPTAWAYAQVCKANDEKATRITDLTTVTEDDVEAVARVIADGMGDNFDDAFFGKAEWIDCRGDKGKGFRDVNMPMKVDYLEGARAALAAFISRKGQP